MKNVSCLSLFAASLAVVGWSTGVFAGGNAILVSAPVEKVFVPQGFDDNDKVEVIVHGHFTSSCYKMGPVTAAINHETNKILVRAESYFYPNAVCIQMMIPFIKSVELPGQLSAGVYSIEVAQSPDLKPTVLSVGRSTSPDPDDYLYAGVNSVDLTRGLPGQSEIVLRGEHPYLLQGCVKFTSVRTYMSPTNVLVVQPITEIVSGDQCPAGASDHHFEERVDVPALATGEYVIHVRALDGNSLNQFVRID